MRKFVHHQPSDPNKTSPVPGTRLEVISGWSLRDDFFWAFFFVVVDLRNRQFARKREEPEFFWGLGGCGLRCVPPSFFLERKNHLEWVGIFSFLPQLGSFAGSRNTSGRTGSWTLSNMWNKKSNQNLTQIPTTRGSTNSFAGWNEDVFTIQKKMVTFFSASVRYMLVYQDVIWGQEIKTPPKTPEVSSLSSQFLSSPYCLHLKKV